MTKPLIILALLAALAWSTSASAQTPPSAAEKQRYQNLHRAALTGDLAALQTLVANGAALNARDDGGRTPAHVAAHAGQREALIALARAGADLDALDHDQYDVVTIAAVADNLPVLQAALQHGASAANITSPYQGTALIAAAHLGHAAVVDALINAGAPLDHINNLGWTALIEAVVLGDGGTRHVDTVRLLVQAGADQTITDRQGQTPRALAAARTYQEILALLAP